MRRHRFILVLALICLDALSSSGTADEVAWNRVAFLEKIRLIPAAHNTWPGGFKYLEKERGAPFTEAERAIYQRSDDGKWKVFEDDLIRFELPEDTLLTIEAISPRERSKIEVVGGAVGTTDPVFERAYLITIGGKNPYGVILVRNAEWFDLGICLCGAIAFEKFHVADGTLQRFSLMEDGTIKKVQALGKQHRAVLFEWTHSAITQEAYARIGASLRLKDTSPRTRDEWRAVAAQHEGRGWEDVAWLDSGHDEKAIVEVLGEPNERKAGALIYRRDEPDSAGGGTRHTLTIPLRDGLFRGFSEKFRDRTDIPAARGTVNWAGRLLDPGRWANPQTSESAIPGLPLSSKALPKLSKQDREAIFSHFLAAEKAYDVETWEGWGSVLEEMAKRGFRDKRVMPAIRRHYLDPKNHARTSTALINLYQPPDRQQLYAQRLKLILDDHGPESGSLATAATLGYLFQYLDRKHPQYPVFVRAAIAHPQDGVRWEGLANAEALPPGEARAAAWGAMLGKRDQFSINRACCLLRKLGVAEDLPRLRERLALEKEGFERSEIEDAIREIEKRAAEGVPKK
jgi:hypothetical protein